MWTAAQTQLEKPLKHLHRPQTNDHFLQLVKWTLKQRSDLPDREERGTGRREDAKSSLQVTGI